MKLIPQDEIDKAALRYAQEYVEYDEDETFTEIDLIDYAQFDFKAGVSFAESKFEELMFEFAEWYYNRAHQFEDNKPEHLYQQFIKDRYAV